MIEPGSELFDQIRTEHAQGATPKAVAERFGISRDEALAVITRVGPVQVEPSAEDEQRCAEALDEWLANPSNTSPLDAYNYLRERCYGTPPVPFTWACGYIREFGAREDLPGVDERVWAVIGAMLGQHVNKLVQGASRQLAGLEIDADEPLAAGVERGLVSVREARSCMDSLVNELVNIGMSAGVPPERLAEWTGVPQEKLLAEAKSYQDMMTS